MTEDEWLVCSNPRKMLGFLHGKASDRKLRLFACGFCLGIKEVLADEDCREAVQVAERVADGVTGPEELQVACQSARLVWAASEWAGMLAANAAETTGWTAASGVQSALEMDNIPREFWRRQADLLRDIFGPRPSRPLTIDASWQSSLVTHLAAIIYQERTFERLPILAEALENAGCKEQEILAHCRESGLHVRGCFVVDLLLGKE